MHILNSGLDDLIKNDEKSAEIKWGNHVVRRFNKRLYFLNKSETLPFLAPDDIPWSIKQSISLDHPIGTLEIDFRDGTGSHWINVPIIFKSSSAKAERKSRPVNKKNKKH